MVQCPSGYLQSRYRDYLFLTRHFAFLQLTISHTSSRLTTFINMDHNSPKKMFYSTLKFKDDVSKALKSAEERAKKGCSPVPIRPQPRQGYSPCETLLTHEQEQMLVKWRLYGVHALPAYVADLTRAHATQYGHGGAHDPHRHVLDDYDQNKGGSGLLLMTMPHKLIEAIISGDIPYRVDNDARFRFITERYCRLLGVPGVYLNVITRCRFNTRTHEKQPHSGCGLSWNELKKVIEHIETEYLMPSTQIGGNEFQVSERPIPLSQ